MGLIKAAASAIGSTFKDQWKEVIKCENLDNDTLMVRKSMPNGVISNGSTVIVAPGQLAVIYDNGQILDATAEEGVYTWDKSSSPSLFAGEFGGMFKEMWSRFTYGGGTFKEQAVFFINIKEILDNKFGTTAPVPYGDWGHPVMNARTGGYVPLSVKIKCHGNYTFKITDPAAFMSELAGTAEIFTREMIREQNNSEVLDTFSNLLNELSSEQYKVPALELRSQTDEIKEMMNQKEYDKALRSRGISIKSFVIESVTLDDESNEKINAYELGGDVYSQKGKIISDYGEALKTAAGNEAGAVNGFMGMGFMNMQTGNMAAGAVNSAMAAEMPTGPAMQGAPGTEKKETKKCPKCGAEVTGKFCQECGTEVVAKKCPKCGAEVTGKFCQECGEKIEE